MDWENLEQPQDVFNELLEAWKLQNTSLTEADLNKQAVTYQLRFVQALDPLIASIVHEVHGDFFQWFTKTGWDEIVYNDLRPRLCQAGLGPKESGRLLTRIALVFGLLADFFNQGNETPADPNAFRQWIEELEVKHFKEDVDDLSTTT